MPNFGTSEYILYNVALLQKKNNNFGEFLSVIV